MGALEGGSLPSDPAQGRSRFQAWREQRTGRDRIPRCALGIGRPARELRMASVAPPWCLASTTTA